MFTIFQESIV